MFELSFRHNRVFIRVVIFVSDMSDDYVLMYCEVYALSPEMVPESAEFTCRSNKTNAS